METGGEQPDGTAGKCVSRVVSGGAPNTLTAREAAARDRVLRETGGKARAAALCLGMSRGGVYVKMMRYGLRVDR